MWTAILVLTGISFGCAWWSLVEVLSDLKYPCAENSEDDMVKAAQVLDYVRIVTGFILLVVVTYGHAFHKEWSEGLRTAYNTVAGSLLALNLATIFIGVVQQSVACTHCVSDTDPDTFAAELKHMLPNSECKLGKGQFMIPSMYCKSSLIFECPRSTVKTSYAERCFVYACSSLVPGVEFRYMFSLIGIVFQAVVNAALLVYDDLWDYPQSGTGTEVAMAKKNEEGASSTSLPLRPRPAARPGMRERKTYSRLSSINF